MDAGEQWEQLISCSEWLLTSLKSAHIHTHWPTAEGIVGSYQAFVPHELPALHSPTQYPSLHTHTHTHTHTQKQANTLQSLWVLDAMGNQSASYWFVQRKYDRPRLEWKQLTLTLRGFFKRAPHSSHWALVVCVVYRWIRMVMDVCAVLSSGCGRQRAVHIGWCQWGTHSIQHTHHILYQQLYTKALTHKYTWLKHTCTHTHTTLILLNGKCFYPKCLTVCILLTKMLTIHTQMAGSCRAGWWLV